MRYLQQLCVAVALTLALALSAFAGDIHCGVTSQQPSQPTSASEESIVDPVTETALNLLQSALSLF
ncbi:MAG TPA: hypothetical protein VD966_04040, partial [Pyrinomonadaceae bacterium]|nr:hypothetical protein [Pyrinomonadaceae bacterium]